TKTRQPFAKLLAVTFIVTTQTIEAGKNIRPGAPAIRQFLAFRMIQPSRQPIQIIELYQYQSQQNQQSGSQACNQTKEIRDQSCCNSHQGQTQCSRDPEQQMRIHVWKPAYFSESI